MCGIIAVLYQVRDCPATEPSVVRAAMERAVAALAQGDGDAGVAAEAIEEADRALRGVSGTRCLLAHREFIPAVRGHLEQIEEWIRGQEGALENLSGAEVGEVEQRNAALVHLEDLCWALRMDRLPTGEAVRDLAGGTVPDGDGGLGTYLALESAFCALDRLEVRGRDSAGIAVMVTGIDPSARPIAELLAGRERQELFTAGAVRRVPGGLEFVYKTAEEIGELGDNVRSLRSQVRRDTLLHRALASDGAEGMVLGHTRWASVGIISEPNAHPLNQEEAVDRPSGHVIAVLNGDVDNHLALREEYGIAAPEGITTDAKVIPVLFGRRAAAGGDTLEAFRTTVAELAGSVAIAARSADDPDKMYLALRGSGQALYVGVADGLFVVASEPYGVIEECSKYLRLDGETVHPDGTRGQVVVLDRRRAGTVAAIGRWTYGGTALPIDEQELVRAEITTRDIDRGAYPHYLLKEIHEAPASFRKTLRGRLLRDGAGWSVVLGEDILPGAVREALASGSLHRVVAVGQGTAAVAARAVAEAFAQVLAGSLQVEVMPGTELSGFHLRSDMADTLVVAISQSGTTTDTNRTVDLVRSRGAKVVAIVNRRGSDLTDKADGVLYTSDGRDVEMSVASTKAFYAQVAAGWLLAFGVAKEVRAGEGDSGGWRQGVLAALAALPAAMEQVLSREEQIAAVAGRHALGKRYWAVVGNGPNHVAAHEVRIKLSELCYKSIPADYTEDKKHIDLSAEPLILVCAAGLSGSTADDVAKEVAIYRAHKAVAVVFASEGETRFDGATEVLFVPRSHPAVAFVLATMAGHLFGYHAALAIDGTAAPLRRARAAVEAVAGATAPVDDPIGDLAECLRPSLQEFTVGLARGSYDGTLEASTATHLLALLSAVAGPATLHDSRVEVEAMGTPGQVLKALEEALTRAIEELTRPVDAIKHQAKTVTVGITRADEALLTAGTVKALLEVGAERDRVCYRDLRALAELDPLVERVTGATRYEISGEPDRAREKVVGRTGVSRTMTSRVEKQPELRGTKHMVACEQELLLARGRADGRTVVLVPEVESGSTRNLTLLHVDLVERADAAILRSALAAYRNRFRALHDAVLETAPKFRSEVLETVPVADLFTLPIHSLLNHWA